MHVPPPQLQDDVPQPKPPTLGGTLGLLGIFAAILIIASYPLISAAAITGTIITVLGMRRYLRNRSKQTRSEKRQLRIPGIGTIEYRITPQ